MAGATVGIDFVANARNLLQEIDKVQGSTGTLNTMRREGIKVLGEEMRAENASARAMLNSARVREQAGRAAVQGAQHAATATRATQALTGAQDAAEGSSRQLRASTINLGNQFMDLGVMISGGSSPARALTMQAPQMLDALRGMSDGVGGVSAAMARLLPFAASLSVVTAAVVALGGAWLYAANTAREAEEAAQAAATAASEAQARHTDLARVRAKAADDEALSLNRVTAADLARRDAIDEVNKAYAPEIEHQQRRIKWAEERRRTLLKEMSTTFGDNVTPDRVMGATELELQPAEVAAFSAEWEKTNRIVADAEAKIGGLGSELAVTAAKTGMAAQEEEKATATRKRSRRATEEATRAEKDRREELERWLALLAEGQRRQEAYANGLEQIRETGTQARLSTLDTPDQIHANAVRELEDLRARTEATADLAMSREQAVAVMEEDARAVAAIRAKEDQALADYYDELERKRQADLRRSQEAAQAKLSAELEPIRIMLDYAQQAASAAAQLTNATLSNSMDKLAQMQAYQAKAEDYLTASQKQQLKERIDAQRAAAIRAFEINKAAMLAGAVINTASAMVAALDDAPWPLNIGLVAAAGILGGIQIGRIAAAKPAFHSGGVVTADLLPGESVLNRRATEQAGRQGIDRMNAGASSGPGAIVIEYRHGHKVVDRAVSAVVRRGGSTRSAVTGLRTSPGFR